MIKRKTKKKGRGEGTCTVNTETFAKSVEGYIRSCAILLSITKYFWGKRIVNQLFAKAFSLLDLQLTTLFVNLYNFLFWFWICFVGVFFAITIIIFAYLQPIHHVLSLISIPKLWNQFHRVKITERQTVRTIPHYYSTSNIIHLLLLHWLSKCFIWVNIHIKYFSRIFYNIISFHVTPHINFLKSF